MSIGLGINIQKKREQLAGPLREAIVDGKHPGLLLDFDDEYYLANGGKKSLDEVLTHSRAGNATMVDSDGLIKWAPHNLLLRSEEFDNSFWAAYAARTVVANATIAPDGTTTADEVIANSANTNNGAFENTVSVSVGSTISFYGPYLVQPTAVRSVIVDDTSGAAITDVAGTHNQSVSYDGFNIFPASNNMTGLISVYGLVGA